MQNADNRLLSASSFQSSVFEAVESEHPFHCATIGDEENGTRTLQSHQMPLSLTQIDEASRAILCLQALTSGLLCLFSSYDVFKILFKILQDHLIHFQQPGTQFEQHGPFASALKDWINAEVVKESFRSKSAKCMEQLDNAARLALSLKLSDLRNTQFFESELVIVFLHWLFTEEYKHDLAIQKVYPTRSFHVWSLAFILSQLGFFLEASTTIIQSREIWEDQVSQINDEHGAWRVYLVTSNSTFADHTYSHRPSRRTEFRALRIVPIGTIPIVMFDHFSCYDSPDLNSSLLNEIFLCTFDEVTGKLLGYPYLRELSGLREGDERPEKDKVEVGLQLTTYQQQKLEDWVDDPGIARLLQRSVSTYIPDQCPDHCGKPRCHYMVPFEGTDYNANEGNRWREELRRDHRNMSPWIQMHAIMIAFAYAVACKFIIIDGNNNRASLDTQVCWKPIQFFENPEDWTKVRITIPDGDSKFRVRTMAAALKFHLEPLDYVPAEKWPQHSRLKKTLFSMICGLPTEVFAGSESFNNPEYITEHTLGCSANGITMISKAVLDPTIDASTLHLYHICFGRILELPLSSEYLIEGCNPQKRGEPGQSYKPPRTRILEAELQSMDVLAKDARWDAEPDWVKDPSKVSMCCRINGLPLAIFSPWWLAKRGCTSKIDPELCECTCSTPRPEHKITFPETEFWMEFSLRDYLCAGAKRNTESSVVSNMKPGETRYSLIRAGKQARNQLAALDFVTARASNKEVEVVRKILGPCVLCAADFARRQPGNWKTLFRGQMSSKKFLNFIILSA